MADVALADLPDPPKMLSVGDLPAPPKSQPTDWLREVALGGRALGEGVLDTLALPHDAGIALQNLMRSGINRVFGSHLEPAPSFASRLSGALTSAGAPVPNTPGEQLTSAAIQGAAGGLTGLGALPAAATAANALRAGISGASGGTASELARQAGMPGWAQFGAGLAGGVAPGLAEGTVRGAVNAIRPITRSGQQQIAANVMGAQATNPQAAAAALDQAAPVIPGSPRTTGEASQDIGLLSLEKGVRGRNPADFGQVISQQNTARQAELQAVGGTPADIAAAETARDAATAPMREAALNPTRMTLYRGQLAGGMPGFDNGGAIWTTPDEQIAQNYATRGLSGPGEVARYDVALRKPFNLTSETAPEFAKFMGPDADLEFLQNEGLTGIDAPTRQRLLNSGYDSVIVHHEAGMQGAAPSVVLLKHPNDLAAPSADVRPVINQIDNVLAGPVGERDVPSQALNWARNKLMGESQQVTTTVRQKVGNFFRQVPQTSNRSAPITDPAKLYAIRQDINDAMDGRLGGEQAKFVLARKELMGVRSALDDAIEAAAPGFKDYLARYREMSKPINQMKVIQEIGRRAELSSADITTGQNFLGTAAFSRALGNALEENGGALTPDQISRLKAIRTDMQYGQAINSPLIKAPGSDTFQNLSIAQVLGAGVTDAHPAFRVLTRPLAWVYRLAGSDQRINQILVDAMLNPKMGAQMLRRATPANVQKFSESLRMFAVPYLAGASGAIASTGGASPQPALAPPTQPQIQ